jgi:hypothetical protein
VSNLQFKIIAISTRRITFSHIRDVNTLKETPITTAEDDNGQESPLEQISFEFITPENITDEGKLIVNDTSKRLYAGYDESVSNPFAMIVTDKLYFTQFRLPTGKLATNTSIVTGKNNNFLITAPIPDENTYLLDPRTTHRVQIQTDQLADMSTRIEITHETLNNIGQLNNSGNFIPIYITYASSSPETPIFYSDLTQGQKRFTMLTGLPHERFHTQETVNLHKITGREFDEESTELTLKTSSTFSMDYFIAARLLSTAATIGLAYLIPRLLLSIQMVDEKKIDYCNYPGELSYTAGITTSEYNHITEIGDTVNYLLPLVTTPLLLLNGLMPNNNKRVGLLSAVSGIVAFSQITLHKSKGMTAAYIKMTHS